LGYRCQPDDAAKIGRELASDLKFVELDEQETLHALATSRKHGVRGGQIHDYLHAIAARKAGALTIFTFNTGDFSSLGLPLTIEPPPCL
jgi:predicted nucleic acid-binding protein